jgi:hypothetical protein
MQGGGRVAGPQPMRTWSPNKLWRSNSIFSLWVYTRRLDCTDCTTDICTGAAKADVEASPGIAQAAVEQTRTGAADTDTPCAKLGNAGLIRDQRYRTDPDAGMPMPD